MLRPGRFTLGKRPGTSCIGSCVSPRAGMDGCGKSRQLPVINGIFMQQNPVRCHSVVGTFRYIFFQFLMKKFSVNKRNGSTTTTCKNSY